MTSPSSVTLLQRFFFGLAEQTFEVKLGVVDPPLVDYLSGLLVRSVRTDQLATLRGARGQVIHEIGQMVEQAETRVDDLRRRIQRSIGDYAMFWAGLFPEALRHTTSSADVDQFGEYCLYGKRAYLIASSIPAEDAESPPCDLLRRLGLEFEMCAYGLREVRREWEESEDDFPGALLA